MSIVLKNILIATLLGFVAVNGELSQQCSIQKKTHLNLANLRDPARILLRLVSDFTADQCFQECCQFSQDDGSRCNAAIFEPMLDFGDVTGSCTLLDCRPAFGNCQWVWSSTTRSTVARVNKVDAASREQPASNQLLQTPESQNYVNDTGSDELTTASVELTTAAMEPTTPLDEFAAQQVLTIPTTVTLPMTLATPTPPIGTNRNEFTDYYDEFDYFDPSQRGSSKPSSSRSMKTNKFAAADQVNDDGFWNLASNNVDGDATITSTVWSEPVLSSPDAMLASASDSQKVEDDVSVASTDFQTMTSSPQDNTIASETRTTEPNVSSEKNGRPVNNDIFENDPQAAEDISIQFEDSTRGSNSTDLSSWAVGMAIMSVVTAIVLAIVAVFGCQRACGTRPRYIALRDDFKPSGSDFPTNYLVSQPTSGVYRSTTMFK